MNKLEHLIARVVQLVEDSPGQMITIVITVDRNGVPVCWQVNQALAEGLPISPESDIVEVQPKRPQKPRNNSSET